MSLQITMIQGHEFQTYFFQELMESSGTESFMPKVPYAIAPTEIS